MDRSRREERSWGHKWVFSLNVQWGGSPGPEGWMMINLPQFASRASFASRSVQLGIWFLLEILYTYTYSLYSLSLPIYSTFLFLPTLYVVYPNIQLL